MSARTGFIAGLTAAVVATTAALWVLQRGSDGAARPGVGAGAAEAEVARPERLGEQDSAPADSRDTQRQDALAAHGATDTADPTGEVGVQARSSGDSALGSASLETTNSAQFAQAIVASLGWVPLGPYEATQLGAEAAQYTSARETALAALAEDRVAPGQWAALTRSAEGLARAWIERFGRARGAQLVEYLGVTAFDPTTGKPRPLDLDGLAQSRRER
ncbi:MAG: hypothetical protein ACYS26_09495 [Planctomycetota bacterium]|jgi:hypothetical protein